MKSLWGGGYSYSIGLAGIAAHTQGKVLQLLANLPGEVPVLQTIRAEGGRWGVPGKDSEKVGEETPCMHPHSLTLYTLTSHFNAHSSAQRGVDTGTCTVQD